ncbi:hypothetical protein BH18THE2_BH18THE2_27830 [soil metagenome]
MQDASYTQIYTDSVMLSKKHFLFALMLMFLYPIGYFESAYAEPTFKDPNLKAELVVEGKKKKIFLLQADVGLYCTLSATFVFIFGIIIFSFFTVSWLTASDFK